MQQLDERERKKREEKDRRLKEERDEEERFKRQLDVERQRLEEERRHSEEKQQREQKRAEALRQALEKAEQQARIEKESKKFKKMRDNFDSMSITSEIDPPKDSHYSRKESISQLSNPYNESKLIQNIYIEQAFSPRRKMLSDQDSISHNTAPSMASETNIIMSNPQSARCGRQLDHYTNDTPIDLNKRQENHRLQSESASGLYQKNSTNLVADAPVNLVQLPLAHEVLTPVQYTHGNSVQMAFLVPQHMNAMYPCLHQPVSMQAIFPTDTTYLHHRNLQMQCQTDKDECCSNRENKVLTPSKYRNQNCRDVFTQTDFAHNTIKPIQQAPDDEEHIPNKSVSVLDQNYEQNTSEEKLNSLNYKKEKRTEDKYKEMESRPKWGVNKPPTQYKKQSEKDIFYPQKRKLRQRKRVQEKNYTSHSSDENRSPSPPRELPKTFPKLDRTRVSLSENYWRKKSLKSDKDLNIASMTIETTQISPLECDQSGIIHIGENFTNNKKVYSENKNSFKRGITLSQKFMNDKYGNPKLWNNGVTDENGKTDSKERPDHRKQYLDSVNRVKKEQSAYYCDAESNQPVILDQLRSLRDSLHKQQQLWGQYDPHNRSPSPKNDVDMEMD